ncbi:calcium ATPase [Plenodomus tracheiphilus IPT5]|uniref:Calcium ATPase n=1 Tax=Plenodomus tracheiphilus IPT5 TaxID=1408161 RepID=A0A6A7AM82_9PLEO|nr:calcium ATPase [Plenodomus tracheiphilus IPT5]
MKTNMECLQRHVLIVLTVAAAISLALGLYETFGVEHPPGSPAPVDWVEGCTIVVANAIIVLVTVVNDWQKEAAFAKLNAKKEQRDIKDTLWKDVDGIFIDGSDVKCDESSATGESDAMRRTPGAAVIKALESGQPAKNLDPFVISGAKVLEGAGTFLATSVGGHSSFGQIMMSVRVEIEATPLQEKLGKLAMAIAYLGTAAASILFFILLFRLQVLARSSPEDKRILVTRLKALEEIVAVTGDGTNDASALKAANVCFSMVSGTEVAKEAFSIILMDDNFSSIIAALMWGRAVNEAVQKLLQFQITVNITAVVLAFVTAIYNDKMKPALRAVQLLWVNLIMDTFAALARATDLPTKKILNRPPQSKGPLITTAMWKPIIGQNIYKITVNSVLYFAGGDILGVLIVFVGGRAFQIKPGGIDGTQWAISIITGFVCIPWVVLIRCFPDEWFDAIAHVVGMPVVVVYHWCCKGMRKAKGLFTRSKKNKEVDAEASPAPAIVVVGDDSSVSENRK